MKEMIIKNIILPFAIKFIEDLLTTENMRYGVDKLFDFVEGVVKDSKTTWDDKTVLPIVEQMRKAIGV